MVERKKNGFFLFFFSLIRLRKEKNERNEKMLERQK